MTQETGVREENEVILTLIAQGKSQEAYERARENLRLAVAAKCGALEGNCAYTLGRAAHECGQHSAALRAYTQALGKAIQFRDKKATASIHFTMATALLERSDGSRRENLELAIGSHIAALGMLTEAARPLDYAKIQYNMGFALAELTTRFGQSFRTEARECFEKAASAFRKAGLESEARMAQQAGRQI
ncbi:MAG: hypothetical protein LAQ69_04885 [Acidobacteriia bacterium]|nr:hypothetical protein [Terriglobia bacterium]